MKLVKTLHLKIACILVTSTFLRQNLCITFLSDLEVRTNAATDPVVIWFNGGPGCSSLLGLFQEHGPMVIEDNTTALIENPYPWNKEANMLYLESPAGVGFSRNTNKSAIAFSDMSQSIDAFAALEVWYAGFSEFMANPLFVSGESYAGVYVPYLSW